MQTIQDFIKTHGITVTFKQVDERPNMDGWDSAARHYRATIRAAGKRYMAWYSQGSGIKDDPEADSLVDCLATDAHCGALGFDDFCGEFGYDQDSRSVHRTWTACKRTHAALVRLLGQEAVESLMYDTERL